jgi:protein SCO1/2
VDEAAPTKRRPWLKIALLTGAVVVGAGVGIGVAVAVAQGDSSGPKAAPSDPGTFWSAGTRRAPAFALRDQAGKPITLASLHGRPAIVAFIDPVCRNLCPLEAKVLNDVVSGFPAASRPTVVAVSVNPWNQTTADLRQDAAKWHLVPQWRWALGTYPALSKVWQKYSIAVQVHTKTLAGVTVHQVDHTEAGYVIDSKGFVRALFLYPYRAQDVAHAIETAD